MAERLYRVGEAAALWGVHENTVRAWDQKGIIHCGRMGGDDGHRVFTLEDINLVRVDLGFHILTREQAEKILKEGHP